MNSRKAISRYNSSPIKNIFNLFIVLIMLPVIILLIILISAFIILLTGFPVFFIQQRTGKNGKVFKLIKFRTMINGADKQQAKYKRLNEADGPVFKIRNDPRYTKVGKFLSRTGLDELPQIINILRGEMYLVGPRPLPTYETRGLTKEQKLRLQVLPGITSPWIVNGHHKHTFNAWMDLDKDYVQNATLLTDIETLLKTFLIPIKYILDLFEKDWK
jgi:lipopolysaccharide/colanic/teichoic acid biosynthesis glycosyltransferase